MWSEDSEGDGEREREICIALNLAVEFIWVVLVVLIPNLTIIIFLAMWATRKLHLPNCSCYGAWVRFNAAVDYVKAWWAQRPAPVESHFWHLAAMVFLMAADTKDLEAQG